MKNTRDFIFLFLVICSTAVSTANNKIDSLINRAQTVAYTNPKQSAYFSQKAIELISPECPNPQKARALLVNGVAYKYLGDFDISIKTLYDARDCCPETEHALYTDILMQISNLYCRLRDYTKAFEINDKATSLSKIYQDSTRLAASYNNRGIIHYSLNEFKTAEQLFRNSLQINRRIGDVKAVAANLNNMCLYEGDINEKLNLIQEAIIINKNMNATWALAENYNNMGKQYYFAKQYPKALEALAKAREAADESAAKELICDNYEYSSWVYSAMRQYDKAYECLLQLYNMSIELQNDQKLRSVEQELSEKRVQNLQKETALKEQAYEIEILKRNTFILVAVLALLVLVAIFLPRWIKRRKDLQLVETRYQLEQSEREVAELKVKQHEQALLHVESELEVTRQEVTSFAMFLRSRNELLDKIREQIKEGYKMDATNIQPHLKKVNAFISQHQVGNEDTNAMLMNIEQKNADFLKRLLTKHPNLTQGERYLATLLRVNLSTKEISLLTGAIPKTINMNRYRLRKSLELQTDEDITTYLQSI
ncbi:tetratricopeptide repeat protein [Bacteroides sp. 51]|uniref:tetratricopeptide repeat protein n=1 Tax=Bacteroides sp. 51 TaxID=2302938 RepID=UPI0013D06406|nr:tetratricopeptide repeat protein [Bacteroides sp. 51]NDV82182.1 tetratricopeptide repeat protein [Bacteroides sp. 51]